MASRPPRRCSCVFLHNSGSGIAMLALLMLGFASDSAAHLIETEDLEGQLFEEDEDSSTFGNGFIDEAGADQASLDRRLQSAEPEHEGVLTNVTPISEDVAADWEHDYEVLKPIIEARGYDVSGAKRLCELPQVFCNTGYRRRVAEYASSLMDDWVGTHYQLILTVKDSSQPAALDPGLFNLKSVGYFQVYVNSGEMPPGIERLNHTKVVWIEGNRTHGLEGGLPAGFWSVKTRMFLLASMGSQFTGHLEQDLPMCNHLDYRLYLYRLQAFTGDISGLSACRNVVNTFEVFLNPYLGGNVWEAMQGWDKVTVSVNIWGSNFTGQVPYADSSTLTDADPWVQWCRARGNAKLNVRISQKVGGSLPAGLKECSNIFTKFDVQDSDISGSFPLDLKDNSILGPVNIKLWGNRFTGPLPDIPAQTESIDLRGNRWDGDIPTSWSAASNLKVIDISDCAMLGPIPNIPESVETVNFGGNHFHGAIPSSWFYNSNLKSVDLSGNNISGVPFIWGWPAKDPHKNYNIAEFLEAYTPSPPWPLEHLKLNDNPLGISVGFLLGMLTQYHLLTLDVSNCGLHNYVDSEDLLAHAPTEDGGITNPPDADALAKLQELNLAHNNLRNFGYNDATSSAGLCWPQGSWNERLPALQILNLKGCSSLEKIHPMAFTIKALNLEGTPELVAPLVAPNSSACESVLGQNVQTCPSEVWQVCVHLVPEYATTLQDETIECGKVAVKSNVDFVPSLLVDAELFDRDVLCRCSLNYEQVGGTCMKVTTTTITTTINEVIVYAGAADEVEAGVALVLAIVIAVAIVALPLCVGAAYFLYRRRQRRGKGKSTDGKEHEEPASEIGPASEGGEGTSQIYQQASDNETSRLFGEMNLMDIMDKGLREHWMIMPEQIQFQDGKVGQGGFGEVRRAMLFGSTDIVVKIPLMKGKELQTSHAQALANEMRLFRRIRHPNIVLFHGVTAIRIGGSPALCLVLEWIGGGDYGKHTRTRRASGAFELSCQEQLNDPQKFMHEHIIMIDVARGMQYLHGQEPPIMHRDLKPGNILIETAEPPRGKIADFGLSVLLVSEDLTAKAGTKSYMAPEVRDRQSYNRSADVYSFGCVCMFSVTGVHPDPMNAKETCELLTKKKGIPLVLPQVGIRCLDSNPASRPDFSQIFQLLAVQDTNDIAGSSNGLGTGTTSFPTLSSSMHLSL